jgi:D-beta-D-heptose 7-phosphate kinase/D-beta-D-heptose 1-phosphate adenosyltransferase|tara:strand:+ start:830 stop:1276 length:447 start_codon:yes stop_codon:yes gene_type:complete
MHKAIRFIDTEPTKRIWLNGTFDVVHLGHIKLFQHAKELYPNSIVCVGVDTDKRIRQLKGPNRPINPLNFRVEFLKAIRFIDQVVTFSTDSDLRNKIASFNPDVMLIGDDYRNRTIVGEELIPRIIYVERFDGLSTTSLIECQNCGYS